MIVLIYHPQERMRAEPFALGLQGEGFQPVLAPIGLQVGTEGWVKQASADIESSDACMLFLTAKSVTDEWVARRAEWAIASGKRLIIPIVLDDPLPDLSCWCLPKEVQYYNWLRAGPSDSEVQRAIGRLVGFLPRPKTPVLCFISYSRADSDFVAKLRVDLRRLEVGAWRDVDDIPAGAAWDNEIEKALQSCSHVLLVVSASSMQSGNVADEIGYARDRNKPIIPLLLDDSALPLRVHRAQAIDFRDNYEKCLQKLVKSLRPTE
jgi:hypothetical protein